MGSSRPGWLRLALCLLVLSGFSDVTFSQETPADTSIDVRATVADMDSVTLFSDGFIKSPRGAMIRSMVFPSWGQFYNESYIKSLVVAGTGAYFVSRIVRFNNDYNDAVEQTDEGRRLGEDVSSFIEARRTARDSRSNNAWLFGLVYVIALADAYVDASLFGFDEAIDVAVLPPGDRLQPVLLTLQVNF